MWAFPREGSAKEQMRKCYEKMTDPDLSGVEMINLERTTKNLQERFSEQGQYQKFVSLFDEYEATQDSDDWLREIADIVKEYE